MKTKLSPEYPGIRRREEPGQGCIALARVSLRIPAECRNAPSVKDTYSELRCLLLKIERQKPRLLVDVPPGQGLILAVRIGDDYVGSSG